MGSQKPSVNWSKQATSVFLLNEVLPSVAEMIQRIIHKPTNRQYTILGEISVPYILMFDADGYLLSFIGAFDTNALSCPGAPARPFQDPSIPARKIRANTMCEHSATLLVMLSNIVG